MKIFLPVSLWQLRVPRRPLHLLEISLLVVLLAHISLTLQRKQLPRQDAGSPPASLLQAVANQCLAPADWQALDAASAGLVAIAPTVLSQSAAGDAPTMPELQLIAVLTRGGVPMVCLFEPIRGRTFLLRPGETDGATGVSLVFARDQQLALLHAASGRLLSLPLGTQIKGVAVTSPSQQP